MSEAPRQSGVVAILSRPDGSVVAAAVDFDDQRSGGCTVTEAQTYRARQALASEAVRTLCTADVADVLQGYGAQQLVDKLERVKRYRITFMPVGGD